MAQKKIIIKGARTHNLKDIDIEIPKNKMVVITGLSGSGKSSLAFDTLYAEGQRRYIESLSAYARQFLGQMDKPDVDAIEGLSPAIAIDQKTTSKNPRSTVGTVTEINDYLRLLWARVGEAYCPIHQQKIAKQSVEEMVETVLALPARSRLQIIAPVVKEQLGNQQEVLDKIKRAGFVRLIIDGAKMEVSDEINLDPNEPHTIQVVVDRIIKKPEIRARLFDSLEAALKLAGGYVQVDVNGEDLLQFSEHFACPICDFKIGELEPRLFSFNSPQGACDNCEGLGEKLALDVDLVVPDRSKTLAQGALAPWEPISSNYYPEMLQQACAAFDIPMDAPFNELTAEQQALILHGDPNKKFIFSFTSPFVGTKTEEIAFEGVMPNVQRRFEKSTSEFTREQMRQYFQSLPCEVCQGHRLNKAALAVKIGERNIGQAADLTISEALTFFQSLEFSREKVVIAEPILKEIISRLSFLENVGLNYLTLSRSARTLSGGEAQRIRLATQIGSNLSGVMYVLDEPSIGLHQRDNDRLLNSLKAMRDLGNTLIIVEHDEETMAAADYLIDMGPGAGDQGGEVIAAGTPKQVMKNSKSLTGQYLAKKKQIAIPQTRRLGNGKFLTITGAQEHNLQNIDVEIPLGTLTAITGVSGSGKSTLINSILKRAVAQKLYHNLAKPGKYETITGLENIEKMIDIDQSPIGKTPRSNPATYTSVFDDIRTLFAETPQAKVRGYAKGRFSFNVKGGRCEVCKGDGIKKIEMNFLPDIYVPCEVCHGTRYNSETLEVEYKGKNIADVLEMKVTEALEFFANVPKIKNKLQTLADVGLGYLSLGQPATTLSGGEAQRVKLAAELYKRSTGNTLYILDEPTTGLHVEDVARLLSVLQRLVDKGNTVLVIEHNLEVIKTADHIIDLGPEGGDQGGLIVATGTPEAVSQVPASYTGQYLQKLLPVS